MPDQKSTEEVLRDGREGEHGREGGRGGVGEKSSPLECFFVLSLETVCTCLTEAAPEDTVTLRFSCLLV